MKTLITFKTLLFLTVVLISTTISAQAPCGTTITTDGDVLTLASPPTLSCTITWNLAANETAFVNSAISDNITIPKAGSGGLIFIVNGGTLIINGSITIENNSNNDFTIQGSGNVVLTGDYTNNGNSNTVFDVAGSLSIQGNVDMGDKGDLTVQAGGDLDIGGTLTSSGADVTVSGTLTADAIETSGGAAVTTPGTGTITAGSCTGDCTEVGIPTPIDLASFQANGTKNSSVQISWVTSSETNNEYFTIERSFDGSSFQAIATIPGAGNSSEPLSYHYTDRPNSFGVIYYRLKQTDFDGASETFPIKRILLDRPAFDQMVFSPSVAMAGSTIQTPNVWGEVQTTSLSLVSLSGKQIRIQGVRTFNNKLEIQVPSRLQEQLYVLKGTVNGIPVKGKIVIR